jgi:hypothetical protein
MRAAGVNERGGVGKILEGEKFVGWWMVFVFNEIGIKGWAVTM